MSCDGEEDWAEMLIFVIDQSKRFKVYFFYLLNEH